MSEWHWVKDRDFPEVFPIDVNGETWRKSKRVLVYGKKYFTPDHRGMKDYSMEYGIGRYIIYRRPPEIWMIADNIEVIAWKYIELKRPRRKNKKET